MEKVSWKNGLLILGASLCIATFGGSIAHADQELFYQEPNEENAQLAIIENQYSDETLTISPENQQLIDRSIMLDKANKDYIDSIIEDYKESAAYSNEQFNQVLNESVTSIISISEQANKNLELATLQLNQEQQQQARVDLTTPARTAYHAGIALVERMGGRQTAWYMLHAEVNSPLSANPSNVSHNNDSWSKTVATDNGFSARIYSRFYNEVYGKQTATLTGGYEFLTGDPAYALAHASYSVTFNRMATGGYKATFKITDVYDFAWGKYENIAVGFGNNYCKAMQTLRLIKPFNISIVYNG